jgi:hypothetical protein
VRKYGPAGPLMTLMIVTTTLFTGIARAADDISTAKDLTAVIALHGQPCGQVIGVKEQGDNDYIASCQDGNRYRVFLNAEGRVVVQKQ